MNIIRNYNDYLFDIITESLDEYNFIISPNLKTYLKTINHPISKILLDDAYFQRKSKFTYIDMIDGKSDKWTFVVSSKLISDALIEYKKQNDKEYKHDVNHILDYLNRSNDLIHKIKSEIKIGRLIQKLFPNTFPLNGQPGRDIESFIKEYASLFESDEKNTKIVEGDDIIYWYNEENYENGVGTLQNSCMRYERIGKFMKFYAINKDKIKLVILLSENNKLKSRALLWKLDYINDKTTDKLFMDRIYYTNEKDLLKMINFAKKNKFLYKNSQSSSPDELIIDSETNEKITYPKFLINDINYVLPELKFPYVDTLCYYNPYDKIITNYQINNNFVELSSTNGITNIIWSSRYNDILIKRTPNVVYDDYNEEYIKKEDAIVLYGDGFKSEQYTHKDNKTVHSKYNNKNYLLNDCEYLERYDDYIPRWILKEHFRYSNFYDEWIAIYDVIYSDHMGDYILKKDAIKVYLNASATKYYYTLEDDPHENFYEYNGKYYIDTISEDEIEKYKKEHENN